MSGDFITVLINVVTYIILAYETAKFNTASIDQAMMWPTFNDDSHSPLAGMLSYVYVYGCVEVRTLSIFKIRKHLR